MANWPGDGMAQPVPLFFFWVVISGRLLATGPRRLRSDQSQMSWVSMICWTGASWLIVKRRAALKTVTSCWGLKASGPNVPWRLNWCRSYVSMLNQLRHYCGTLIWRGSRFDSRSQSLNFGSCFEAWFIFCLSGCAIACFRSCISHSPHPAIAGRFGLNTQPGFQQAAGFLRIFGGSEPLDSLPVHPESGSAHDVFFHHRMFLCFCEIITV